MDRNSWIVQFAFDTFIWIVFSPQSSLFLLLILLLLVGLHPWSRWIQEHYLWSLRETYSYYGPLEVRSRSM